MLKKQICHWVQKKKKKNAMQNNMIQQCLYHGGIAYISFFLHPMANLFFLAYLLLSVFYTRLMRPNKVETGRGLLT